MNMPENAWKFDESVAEVFAQHVRQSVPLYDEFHDMIAHLSQFFIEDGTQVYDLGTSTGEVLSRLIPLHKDKEDIKLVGLDNSQPMITIARERLQELHPVILLEEDITDFEITNASFVTAVLTLQFISLEKRLEVLENVYDGLNKGGALVIVEKVVSEDSQINDTFVQLYHDLKQRNGLTAKEVIDKQKSIRGVMKPISIKENLQMLKLAGFDKIDTFFQWNNFAGFIAIK